MDRQTKNKVATIYDIARLAHTSPATVSRVLSGSEYPVSAGTREKIEKVAKELKYAPNLLGRMFKKNEAGDIGVIVPTIQNPFYTQVVMGVETEVRKSGYDVLLYNSYRDVEAERRHIQKLGQKQVKGLIISSVDANAAALTGYLKSGGRVVLFDQCMNLPGSIKVGFDFVGASRMAVDYLIAMGHRDIAFLSAPPVIKSRMGNLEGYKRALAENGIPLRNEFIIISEKEYEIEDGMYEFENGKELAKAFHRLKTRPTAIFSVNDITAVGIIQQLAAMGVAVPDDVSVMGFDNLEIAKLVNPPLTTVAQPSFETGRLAGMMLVEFLCRCDSASSLSVTLEPTLVVRNSVKKLD